MLLRDPICLAIGAVNFTDSGPVQSWPALDFANALNSRLKHVSQFTVYPASPLQADHAALCCPRYRKALSTALLGFVLTAPALTEEGSLRNALPAVGVDFSVSHLRSTLVPADDLRVVWVLKHGLRGATALFGRFSAKANVRNVATMTAGVRN